VAAQITSTEINAVVTAAQEVPVTDSDEWHARVEKPALALENGAVGLLSEGWETGLGEYYILFWFGAAPACFIGALLIQVPGLKPILSALMLAVLLVPLYMSTSVANVSTSCDDVLEQLITIRKTDLGTHSQLQSLETALRYLSGGDGLGFMLFGVVLDKSKQKALITTVLAVFATAVPAVLALYATMTSSVMPITDVPKPGSVAAW